MKKTKVFLVDDSMVIQRKLSGIISEDPSLLVAGFANNGRIAMAKIAEAKPDIVIMDVEMPEMDGLETLSALRKVFPKMPVIMFSTQTERGAASTIDALLLGADDYVTKPTNLGTSHDSIQQIRNQLISKIKALCSKSNTVASLVTPLPFANALSSKEITLKAQRTEKQSAGTAAVLLPQGRIDIVVIGSSTGGPNALQSIIPRLPKNFPVPVLLVQHMPPVFTKALANNLSSKSLINVLEAQDNDFIFPGSAWIAPGDYHMGVVRDAQGGRIRLSKAPQENFCRPAVDWLFRSVAQVYGGHVLGVVLTGMGQDGYKGCEFIRSMGGYILIQDEASSVVWGMPGFVARAGLADEVLSLEEIASGITSIVTRKIVASQRGSE